MGAVYSIRLLGFELGHIAGTKQVTVPAGFVWVVRSISMMNRIGEPAAVNGFAVWIENSGGQQFFLAQVSDFEARSYFTYQWNLHAVLNPTDILGITTYDSSWSGQVSGYQLSTP